MSIEVTFRTAEEQDLEKIVELLAKDALGNIRESNTRPLPESYLKAFQSIQSDLNNELIVVSLEDEVIGVQQITYTPYLTYQGGWRATIEGVRTSASYRGKGIGAQMIQYAIQRAKERGCHLVQLTTDKKREDAKRFYEKLGFQATHEGMKLHL